MKPEQDTSPRIRCPYCVNKNYRRVGNERMMNCHNCNGRGSMTENELKLLRERTERMRILVDFLHKKATTASESKEEEIITRD